MKKMKLQLLATVVVALTAIFTAGSAQAGFAGNTLDYTYLFPTSGSVSYHSPLLTVGAGVELPGLFSAGPDVATMDISDSNILIDYANDAAFGASGWVRGAFNGFRLFDIGGVNPAITSVTVNGATTMGGFSGANVSFDADNIYVNWQGLNFDSSTIVSLDVGFGAVPEPSTFIAGALLAFPFGLQGARWLRNRKQAS
jgi:hypothetical protein